jgi:hypothetical protein
MTFFKGLMRTLAAFGAVALPLLLHFLVEFFGTFVPSDVATGLWAVVSALAVLLLNLALGKVKNPL